MDSHAVNSSLAGSALLRWLLVAFISGFVAVLIFHQGAFELMRALGMKVPAPYSMNPTRPFGVPLVWSLAFWGGVWGVVLAAALYRMEGWTLVIGSIIFGAILPTLVYFFVVAPLKGLPVPTGWVTPATMIGLIVNGAWGLGTALGLILFGRARRSAAP